MAIDLIKDKKHLTEKGLHNIIAIKASMNREDLSDVIKAAFPSSARFVCEHMSMFTLLPSVRRNSYYTYK